jgi:hypothetical protein
LKGQGTIEVIVTHNQAFIVMNKQHVVVKAFQLAIYNVSTKRFTVIDIDIKGVSYGVSDKNKIITKATKLFLARSICSLYCASSG